MVPVWVKKCSIFNEFAPEQQRQMFEICRDKTLHHIDTFYYSVSLNEPDDIVKKQRDNDLPENFTQFLQVLRENREKIREFTGDAPRFGDLEMVYKSFSIYEYCVSLNECFDIFISSYLPTEETPRIVVQLRSRYIVLQGIKKAIEESFEYLRKFLNPFGLLPTRVRENRVDYAYHTNLIQNPEVYFDDELLRKHCKTNLRKFSKYGDTKEFKTDTFNLGRRKSNSVFLRAYNKVREVIEENYKSFFILRWYENGLISNFDKYVYEIAFEYGTYRSGILMGRLKWYLEYGTNEDLKAECRKLIATNFVNSDNYDHIERKIHYVIPEPTVIFNIEFQVKRKFFVTCAEWIQFNVDIADYFEISDKEAVDSNFCLPRFCDPLLRDIFGIVFSSPQILSYLTGFGNSVSFVEDRHMSFKKFKEADEPYLNWWKRIRSTPITYSYTSGVDLYREYDMNMNSRRSRRIVEGNVARLSMINRCDTSNSSFIEDMADVLCVLNDNDTVPRFVPNYELLTGDDGLVYDLYMFDPLDYQEIRYRKARQLRGVMHGSNKDSINNTSAASEEKEG